MCVVRLIRRVLEPNGTGPGNGQFALQRALGRRVRAGLDWLRIGGAPQPSELPWYWSWQDRAAAVRWARQGRPFVQGPNTVLLFSRRPRADALESTLLDAPQCRLMFTESEWYRELLLEVRGPENRAPVVLWPYPIDPQPAGPLERPQYELLIYHKNGRFPGLVEQLQAAYPNSVVIRYGHYRRHEMWDVARRSRCCCYLADDDRGPLALAEILLCGCPAVGLPKGAPFVEPGWSGTLVRCQIGKGNGCQEPFPADRLHPPRASSPETVPDTLSGAWLEAVETCRGLDRQGVAAWARREFDAERITEVVLAALARARKGKRCQEPFPADRLHLPRDPSPETVPDTVSGAPR